MKARSRPGARCLVSLVSLVALACAPDRDLPSLDGGSARCEGTTPHTLDEVFASSFATSRATGCSAAGCHGTGAGHLLFRDAHELWMATVNHASVGGNGMALVRPGSAGDSFLLQKLEAGASDRMPQGGPYLDDTALAALAGWICAGAPEPAPSAPDAGTPDAGSAGPQIASLSPTSGVVGTQVTLTGSGLSPTATDDVVRFGTAVATVATASPTTLLVSVPVGATSGPVSVTVLGLTATSAERFEVIVPNPSPTLDAVSPAELGAGADDTALDLSGSSFVATSTAQLDGEALLTAFVSDARLTATLTAARLAHAGNHTVTVVTPGPGGGTSAGRALTVKNPVPAVTSLSPATTLVGSGAVVVTVTGRGLAAETTATLNGADLAVTPSGPTQLSVTIPSATTATAGTLALTLANPGPGGGTSAPATFSVLNPSPVVTGIAPAELVAGSGAFTLAVFGAAFGANATVTFDGNPVATTRTSTTQLGAALPATLVARAGAHTIAVTTPAPGGGTSSGAALVVKNPAPVLGSLSPVSAAVASGAVTLSVAGSGFVADTKATLDGADLPVTVLSAALLSLSVPAGATSTAGVHAVALQNAAPGGGASTSATFTVTNPSPTLTSIVPAELLVGAGALTLGLTGGGFVAGSVVALDGSALSTTFIDGTRLGAAVPSSVAARAGSHQITVTTPGPGGGTSQGLGLVVKNPLPQLSSLSPGSTQVTSGAVTLTVGGGGFVADTKASVNGVDVPVTLVSASQLSVTVPASLTSTAGVLAVVLTNAAPGGGTSASASFTVTNPSPMLASVAPAGAVAGCGALALTVTGGGFVVGSSVLLDGSALATTFLSATLLAATVPVTATAAAGAHTVAVTTPSPGGGTSAAVAWTVGNPAPVVTSVSPGILTVGSTAQSLTLTGSGFLAASQVTANGASLATSAQTATQLVATVPASLLGSTGTLWVTVTNATPGGGASAASSVSVVNPAPGIAALSPASTTAGGGAVTVTLSGSGFVPGSQGQFDGSNVTTSFTSASLLDVSIPAAATGVGATHTLAVKNATPGGGTSAAATFTVDNPVPTIAAISPASVGTNGAPFTLTIAGTNFNAASSVTFNGASVPAAFVSATSLTADLPTIASPGSYSVKVTNPAPGGGLATASLSATSSPLPSITGLSPATGPANSPFSLTVSGSNYNCSAPASVVFFAGAPLTPASCSTTQLVVSVPATAAGVDTVQVKNGGQASNTVNYPVTTPNPVPVLSSLSPGSAAAGDASFTLTVNGTSLVSGTTVQLGGSPRPTTFVSASRLTATILASDVASAGSASVTAVSPAPGGGTSNALAFAIAAPNPVPSLSALSPTGVAAGSGSVTVTVVGSGFIAASVATFNGASRTTHFVGGTQLTVDLAASDTQTGGAATIAVVNPAPGGGTSGGLTFAVTAQNPVPVLSSLSPASATAGGASFVLTATGSAFVSGSAIVFNGTARATTFVSATQLTATLAAADVASAGSLPVTVASPGPGGGTSGSVAFLVNNPAPSISSLSPSGVVAGSGGISVTVAGAGFVSTSAVALDGASRTTHFVGAGQLTADLLAGDTQSAATHTVVVTNPAPGGGTSTGATFTVTAQNPVPVLSSLSPTSTLAGSAAFTLTATGSAFVSGSAIVFNGATKTTSFVSATQLTATVAAADVASAGSNAVTVTSPGPGGGTSGAVAFTVNNPAPVVSSLSPASVAAGSGAVSVTVAGTGFVSTSAATLDASARTTHFVSATQLTVDLLASDTVSAAAHSVVVTNPTPGGGASSGSTFTVTTQNPVPVLSTLSPASALAGSASFTLTANGTGFVVGSAIVFNGVAKTTAFVSSTQLTATVAAADVASAGSDPVTVTSPGPGGGTSGSVAFAVDNPAPGISSLSPAGVAAGSGPVTVTVGGTGFVATSAVTLDAGARTTHFVSATQVTVDLVASDTQTTATHTVVVTNPAPGGGASGGFTFSVVSTNPVPTLASLSPSAVAAGASAFTLTVNGTGFVTGVAVQLNGVTKTTTFVSSTQATAGISSADVVAAGSYPVAIVNPTPGGGTSGSLNLTVNNPAPTISSLSPSTVTVGSGAFSLSVNGAGFVSASTVAVDGAARTTHFVNTTLVTADLLSSDDASTTTHGITVTNPTPGGGTSTGATLTVASQPNPTPVVSALSPCGKAAGSGSFTLTVTGTGFVSGATATFNGTAVTVTFVGSTQVTAAIPGTLIATAPAADAASLVVTNPGPGGGASNTAVFGVATKTATLSGNVQTIFTNSCATASCHSGSTPADGLNLQSGSAYANLVGVASNQCSGRLRVLSCGPQTTQSYLVAKLEGLDLCSGSQMPKGAPLSSANIQTIVDWVAQGAPP